MGGVVEDDDQTIGAQVERGRLREQRLHSFHSRVIPLDRAALVVPHELPHHAEVFFSDDMHGHTGMILLWWLEAEQHSEREGEELRILIQ